MGKIIYGIVGVGSLLFWVVTSQAGFDLGGTSYKLPPSVRQSPGGYRSFFFWHAGYQAGSESESMKLDAILNAIVGSLVFSGIGMLMFALAMFIVSKVLPFSIRKEIEEDQNTSLGIVLGSIIIGLSLILSAAIH